MYKDTQAGEVPVSQLPQKIVRDQVQCVIIIRITEKVYKYKVSSHQSPNLESIKMGIAKYYENFSHNQKQR